MNRLKLFLTLMSAIILIPSVGWGAVEDDEIWSSGFEQSPGDGDSVAAGAGKIRATRSGVGARAKAEHFWGYLDNTADDNGLHREGSARCYIADTAPTALTDTAVEYNNTGGAESGTLSALAANSAGAAKNRIGHGRCWIDSNDGNKMYVYHGGTGWLPAVGEQVRAGAPNILFNGDFDQDGCTGTDDPTGWTSIDAETVAYESGTDATQGSGCVAVVTDVDGGDGYKQLLSQLKSATVYRVVAQVKEAGADECILTTTGASSNASATSTSTSWVQLNTSFTTGATLDDVWLLLTSTATADVCYWDHIAVYREETHEVPEGAVIAVFDTYTTSEGAAVSASGVGFAAVPDLSIVFVPPSEGWNISLQGNVSLGCSGNECNSAWNPDEGVVCHLAVGGSEITGTQRAWVHAEELSIGDSPIAQLTLNTVVRNPVAGTSLTYTVACVEEDDGGASDAVFNPVTNDNSRETQSTLTMIAYPPH